MRRQVWSWHRHLLLTLLVVGPIGVEAVAAGSDFELPAPGSYALPVLGDAADGEVFTGTGQRLPLRSLFAGRIVLLSFIYTRCSDSGGCPLATAILKQVMTRLQKLGVDQRVRALSLSFDPDHDTPEVMRQYAARFNAQSGSDWLFITGTSAKSVRQIAADYGQDVEPDSGTVTGGGINHLLRVILIDADGKIRNIYGSSVLDVELLVNDVVSLNARSGVKSPPVQPAKSTDLMQRARRPRHGLPVVPIPANNPLNTAKINLGRKLFFDRRLSINETLSCANCHVPEQGFASNEMATAVGVEGRTVRRNAPTLLDVGYLSALFHDGRETALETQVWSPLLAVNEMAAPSVGWIVAKIQGLSDYHGLFEQAFGRPAAMENIGQALASYERVLVSGESAFDRWHYAHDTKALEAVAQRGFELFTTKAHCSSCHLLGEREALFTDGLFHVTGIGWLQSMRPQSSIADVPLAPGVTQDLGPPILDPFRSIAGNDLGRYEVTLNPADRWAYRTPGLRNVALTAPYMHDGSLPTLEAVVEFYDKGAVPEAPLDAVIKPLHLTADERADLVAFLRCLTGDGIDVLLDDAQRAPIGNP